MLHRVEPETEAREFDPNAHLRITPEFLDSVLAMLADENIDFVDLDEAAWRIGSATTQRRFVSITLDDGYKNNLVHAAPVFEAHSVPYTIFVAPGLVDGRATLWWEDLENVISQNTQVEFGFPTGPEMFAAEKPEEKKSTFKTLLHRLTNEVSEPEQRQIMKEASARHGWDAQSHRANSIMDWDELREIAKDPLCSLGAHTIHHYAVARLSPAECRIELRQSADEIGSRIGKRPLHFAYPYGYEAAAGARDFQIAKECGFATAVTTRHGVCYTQHAKHLMALPRISLNGLFQKRFYLRSLLSGGPTILQNRGRKLNVG